MSKEDEQRTLLKIQIYHMVKYLIDAYKVTYKEALEKILHSKTYLHLLNNELYLNQGSNYILEDFKQELA